MASLGFLAVAIVFGIGLILLVIATAVALVDNRVNYGRWRPRKPASDDAIGSEAPPE